MGEGNVVRGVGDPTCGPVENGVATIAAAAVDRFAEYLWPRRRDVDLGPVLSRARLLLAQASAALVVHELGEALARQAATDDAGELEKLIDRIAIGQVRQLTTPAADDQEQS